MTGAGKGYAIIIGGSMSGLFAALMLRQRGFEVDDYERVESEMAGRGAGIVAQPVVAATLRRLDLPTADLGVEATTRRILDLEGRTLVLAGSIAVVSPTTATVPWSLETEELVFRETAASAP